MAVVAEYQTLPLTRLHESPLNPRKHVNAAALQELAASIKAHGVLTPLLVRPNAKGFEIAAGHRRYRAAQLAGVAEVPAVVRDMPDAEFLEILVVENDQREDVHPLEQAAGYKALMLLDGYDAKRIADRIGRSEKWVYDRIKLLQLTKEAQQLFLEGRITAGHAILLARLSPKDQARALEVPELGYNGGRGGLWQDENGPDELFEDEAGEKKKHKDPLARYEGFKPVSVRELDAWIAEHVRFDAKTADPVLFPAVVEAVAEAPKPLVPITSLYHVPDEARDGTVRTYGPTSWKRADGAKGSGTKACPYAVGAVVAVGPGRGETFPVCLRANLEKCATHWAKERRELERRRKQNAAGTSTRRVDNTYEKLEERRKAEEAKREAVRARFKKAGRKILEAFAAAVDKAPLARIGAVVLDPLQPDRWTEQNVGTKLTDVHQPGKTAEALLRHAAFCTLYEDVGSWRGVDELPKIGKAWGVDVWAIVNKEAPAPKPEAAAKDKPKKKAATR